MCNLYSVTSSQQAIRDLARAMRDVAGNLPPLPAVYPDQMAPVVRTAPDGVQKLMMMRWGFPQKQPQPGEKKRTGNVTNVRHPTWNYWKPWMQCANRCLIPGKVREAIMLREQKSRQAASKQPMDFPLVSDCNNKSHDTNRHSDAF